jgi:hypothetical protein
MEPKFFSPKKDARSGGGILFPRDHGHVAIAGK